jgi:hypothetical protein
MHCGLSPRLCRPASSTNWLPTPGKWTRKKTPNHEPAARLHPLPRPPAADAPPQARTCRDYATWRARLAGGALTDAEADALMLFRLWCGLDEVLRQGRPAEARAEGEGFEPTWPRGRTV